MMNPKPSLSIHIDSRIRTSGFLAHLSPQNLQTLLCLMTYSDDNGVCVASGRDVARCLDLSEKQGSERLRRLSQSRFDNKPVITTDGLGRAGSGRFAKGRFRISSLPGLYIWLGRNMVRKSGGYGSPSVEGGFLVSPGETVKLASGSTEDNHKGEYNNINGVVNNKTTQQTGMYKDNQNEMLELLRDTGVSEFTAQEMVRHYPAERIKRQTELLPYREARDPAAMLVKSIREDWVPPASYAAAMREKALKLEKAKAESDREAEREAHERRVEKAMSELSPEELEKITQRAKEKVKAGLNNAMGGRIPQSLVDAQVKKIINQEYLDEPNRKNGE